VDIWAGEARDIDNPTEEFFYDKGSIMVHLPGKKRTYGNIRKLVNEEISQIALLKYIKRKNPHWTDGIFDTID